MIIWSTLVIIRIIWSTLVSLRCQPLLCSLAQEQITTVNTIGHANLGKGGKNRRWEYNGMRSEFCLSTTSGMIHPQQKDAHIQDSDLGSGRRNLRNTKANQYQVCSNIDDCVYVVLVRFLRTGWQLLPNIRSS